MALKEKNSNKELSADKRPIYIGHGVRSRHVSPTMRIYWNSLKQRLDHELTNSLTVATYKL